MDKFRILEMILENPQLSQKKIAEQASISIGKVNYVINELVEEGSLLIEKVGKSFRYTVTEKARHFLLNEIDELQQTKISFHDTERKSVKQAVILAAGTKSDFDKPVCLIEIDEGVTLLDRMLNTLLNNGIEKIVIVSGYKKEAFYKKALPPNVTIVENNKYRWTGSMASLAAAHEEIDDDFILIEDDILIEEIAIQKLLKYHERDCLLVMNESGSKDEAYIEIKNGYLYKISKDFHQLNRIDGEVIGVTKISKVVFDEMLEMYKSNKNPYMNYEYMILDVSRKIDIGFLKMNDLIWAEVDNTAHYEIVTQKVYPIIKRREERIKSEEVKKQIQRALDVSPDEIKGIQAFGGMTNLNYRVSIGAEDFVVRMPGAGTEEFIDRSEEKENLELGAALGINPDQLYFNTETGLKITAMISNAETLTPRMTKKEEIMKMVTANLRILHQSPVKMKNSFDLFGLMEKYEKIARGANGIFFDGFEKVKEEVYEIKKYYESLTVEYAPTHIDALYQNFIKSGDDKLYLIDWEYSGMFDPLWDLATHSIESEFTTLEEELFLSHYFQEDITEIEQRRILIHKIFQDYLWTMWTIFKEAKGDDFGSYGKDRFERLQKNLTHYKNLYNGVITI